MSRQTLPKDDEIFDPPPLSNEEEAQRPQSPFNEERPRQQHYDGIWIGIDLGTSNCAAAVWDSSRQRAKSLRFRNPLAKKACSGKNGRVVPSCLFYPHSRIANETKNDDNSNDNNGDDDNNDDDDGRMVESQQWVVGNEAVQKFEESNLQMNLEIDEKGGGVLVTSAKRIWGMTASQIRVELQDDEAFLDSLPFEVRLVSNEDATDRDTDTEGARICTGRDARGTSQWTEPMDVATILLRSIRTAAQEFLDGERRRSNGIHPVGAAAGDNNDTAMVRNCVVGVPAHFGRNQRRVVEEAARNAGFDGYVATITESTAAALAYGLFVSPAPSTNNLQTIQHLHDQHDDDAHHDDDTSTSSGKTILVFDMGGGTTDVTIATMANTATHHNHSKGKNPVSFRVRATAGDRHLGGDDMDEILLRRIAPALLPPETNENRNSSQQLKQQQQLQQQLQQDQKYHRANLLRLCRKAKEELCGDGTGDVPPSPIATLEYHGKKVEITREDFDDMIVPLVKRARDVVERALDSFHAQNDPNDDDPNDDDPNDDSDYNHKNNTKCPQNKHANTIHEVVLVGGATRTPSIRTMLRSKFPPPMPPNLCHSINAEAAVAQGAAIHAAISSGRVPNHEIRSALMLDALPHSIGVLVGSPRADNGAGGEMATNDNDNDENGDDDDGELFVPVLKKDSPLPAMDYVTFTLADVHQKGVTVIAVEDVGDDLPLQRIGEFNFLLHRMTHEEIDAKLHNGKRTVDIGMTVDKDGKFIVSIFDSNDPEHLLKKKRYLTNRKNAVREDATGYILHEKGERQSATGSISKTPMEQIYLTIICMALFLLYVAARLAFHVPEEGAQIL